MHLLASVSTILENEISKFQICQMTVERNLTPIRTHLLFHLSRIRKSLI